MKHGFDMNAARRLLSEIDVTVADADLETLGRHLEWVLERTRVVNLTAIRDPQEALRLHVVDSLVALPEVERGPKGELLDIGTGGGYPGLPLAVVTHRPATLIDSASKKARTLAEFVTQEGLEDRIHVLGVRAEELAAEEPSRFAVVVARAVSSLASLIELSSPNLREAGVLVAMKAVVPDEELESAAIVASRCGMEHRGTRTIRLPDGGETRAILTYERVGPSEVTLPRRVGLAQKRPLG